jgi:hypothetical protein
MARPSSDAGAPRSKARAVDLERRPATLRWCRDGAAKTVRTALSSRPSSRADSMACASKFGVAIAGLTPLAGLAAYQARRPAGSGRAGDAAMAARRPPCSRVAIPPGKSRTTGWYAQCRAGSAALHRWLCSVIRGHCNYYGVPTNARALATFRRQVEYTWHRQLQRRSQRARWTVEKIQRFEARYPLPSTRIVHPWPERRFHGP